MGPHHGHGTPLWHRRSPCNGAGDPQPTCASFQTVWLASQFLNGGCAEDSKFFDLKTLGMEVAAPEGEAEVKAACCTAFEDAQCSDWAAVKGSCPSGQAFVGTNSAP